MKDFSGANGILYRCHLSNTGWENFWKKSGQTSGTTREARPIEAVQIKLTGVLSSYYDVYYRVHSANYGWLGWAENGETAGTTGGGLRAEALQIKIVPKSQSVEPHEKWTALYS